MKGKEIAINKLFEMSIDDICKCNMKETNINKLKSIKSMNKDDLNKMTTLELAELLRTVWICPQTFELDDYLCMKVLSCVNCMDYALEKNY
jgi:hypothetical protein